MAQVEPPTVSVEQAYELRSLRESVSARLAGDPWFPSDRRSSKSELGVFSL